MVVSFAFIPAERIKDLQRKFKQQHTPDVSQNNCTCCCPVIAATGSTTATGHPWHHNSNNSSSSSSTTSNCSRCISSCQSRQGNHCSHRRCHSRQMGPKDLQRQPYPRAVTNPFSQKIRPKNLRRKGRASRLSNSQAIRTRTSSRIRSFSS